MKTLKSGAGNGASVSKFLNRKATVGIVGLGYVGVPLAVEFGNAGYKVIGFDTLESKVRRINAGEDVILDVEPGSVRTLRDKKKLSATSDFKKIRECDAVIICVPTPLDDHKEPDLHPVRAATHSIAPHVKKGQVIVLESTTYPGTTREVLQPILEAGGMKVGRDFHLGFSPERVDPGNAVYKTKNTPKIVSGITPKCLALIEGLYSGVIDQLVTVSSPETAETAKLLENIFRNVNIALVNELMLLSDRMGIDIWEVIDAAATKPFGFTPFYPGPGVGGHCIPIDPFYLSWKAKEFDFFTNFIMLSAEVNENIPYYVVEKTAREVNLRLGRPIKGMTIMIIGVAFKKNVDDARNTPAEKIMRKL
ncbi:MAG: nucleotide sugar dehydrogenase, partial [Candidatus Hydrogenedentota bacterium]